MTSAVERLEGDFAAQHGFAGAVAAGFGRAALRLALEAAEVRGGDVLVPDFVCAQVPEAVRRAAATPIYFPVASDLTVASPAFRAAITPATRAAIAVHYFGRPLPSIRLLAEICRERRIPLIEDCALAMGSGETGTHGSIAVFSFTKSDWCYGGGLVAARAPEIVERARTFREKSFSSVPAPAWRYGVLRRADFAANRPTRSRAAEFGGRTLEMLFGLHAEGFYNAGSFDTQMPNFAARRASRIIEGLRSVTERRRAIVEEIRRSLGPADRVLLRRDACPQDSCGFLLLRCEFEQAHSWRERAGREGVTLRLCWPAYQDCEPAQETPDLRRLAENLLVLEIHPDLTGREVRRIVQCLQDLAAM